MCFVTKSNFSSFYFTFMLHLRYSQLVFFHETALYFHDLTDREPFPYSATVKRGYNTSGLKEEGVSVYTVKKELHGIGVTSMKTSFGHSVPVYDMERTICDLIRSRNSTKKSVKMHPGCFIILR